MKVVLRRSIALTLAAILLASLFAVPVAMAAPAKKIKTVSVDGIKVTADVVPTAKGKTAMVSLKTIERALGAKTTYKSKKATIKTTLNTVVFTLGKKTCTVNGKSVKVSQAPVLVKKKIMVPADTLMKALGGSAKISGTALNLTYFGTIKGGLKVHGSSTLYPIAQAASTKINKMKGASGVAVTQLDSGDGIKQTIAGTVNLGMASRELKTDGSESGLTTYAVAKDGIAIIVNPKNNVSALSKQQAVDIFMGKITDWSQVGGAPGAITVFTREAQSGTLGTVVDLLLGKGNSIKSGATVKNSSGLMKDAVAKNANGIGFDSIGFVDKSVKAVKLDGVAPSAATVKSGKYLMGRSLYIVSKGQPVPNGAKFIDFLKSDFAQKIIVQKLGYIVL